MRMGFKFFYKQIETKESIVLSYEFAHYLGPVSEEDTGYSGEDETVPCNPD